MDESVCYNLMIYVDVFSYPCPNFDAFKALLVLASIRSRKTHSNIMKSNGYHFRELCENPIGRGPAHIFKVLREMMNQ